MCLFIVAVALSCLHACLCTRVKDGKVRCTRIRTNTRTLWVVYNVTLQCVCVCTYSEKGLIRLLSWRVGSVASDGGLLFTVIAGRYGTPLTMEVIEFSSQLWLGGWLHTLAHEPPFFFFLSIAGQRGVQWRCCRCILIESKFNAF